MDNNEKYNAQLKELKENLVKAQQKRWTAMRARYWDYDFRQAVDIAFARGFELAKQFQDK